MTRWSDVHGSELLYFWAFLIFSSIFYSLTFFFAPSPFLSPGSKWRFYPRSTTHAHTHTRLKGRLAEQGPAGTVWAVRCCKEARWLQNNLFFLVCFLTFIKAAVGRSHAHVRAHTGRLGVFSKDTAVAAVKGNHPRPPAQPIAAAPISPEGTRGWKEQRHHMVSKVIASQPKTDGDGLQM